MISVEEKIARAYERNELVELLTGQVEYYEREEYMAPTIVPTNWQRVLESLSLASSKLPDLSSRVQAALVEMTTTAEGFYSALECLRIYLEAKDSFLSGLKLNEAEVIEALKLHAPLVEERARNVHLSWMGPTVETLSERMLTTARFLERDHGVRIFD